MFNMSSLKERWDQNMNLRSIALLYRILLLKYSQYTIHFQLVILYHQIDKKLAISLS